MRGLKSLQVNSNLEFHESINANFPPDDNDAIGIE